MESWTPREAARKTPVYFLVALAVTVVLELLLFESTATLGDAIGRGLPIAIGIAGGFAFVHLARWHYERTAA